MWMQDEPHFLSFVMPGLVPGIPNRRAMRLSKRDGRDFRAKTRFALSPGHDGNEMPSCLVMRAT